MTRVVDPGGPVIPIEVLARRRARTPAIVSFRITREAERASMIRRLAELSRPIAPARTCQFPTVDQPFTVCGHASVPGMSWCAEHRAVVFRQTDKPRELPTYIEQKRF